MDTVIQIEDIVGQVWNTAEASKKNHSIIRMETLVWAREELLFLVARTQEDERAKIISQMMGGTTVETLNAIICTLRSMLDNANLKEETNETTG